MKKTVFVVGAGASTDFALPVGTGLADWIRTQLTAEVTEQRMPLTRIAMSSNLPGNYTNAVEDIAGGLLAARSIDRFLHSRRGQPLVEIVGKVCIGAGIAAHESLGYLGNMVDDHDNEWLGRQTGLSNARATWLHRLFSLLSEGVEPENSHTIMSEISFITFNYDRCIERYLCLAFQQTMRRTKEEAAQLVKAIPIEHVYGSLGPLPGLGIGMGEIPYGAGERFWGLTYQGLRTFTESLEDGVVDRLRALIDEAEVLVFLGFAFDPLNVDALFRRGTLRPEQEVIGTIRDVAAPTLAGFRRAAFGFDPNRPISEFEREKLYGSSCADFVNTLELRSTLGLQ